MNQQRVLLVHRFFRPDATTYARMLEIFAAYLADLGHDVTVLTGTPSYNTDQGAARPPRRESADGFQIRRLRIPGLNARQKKLFGQLYFPLATLLHILRQREPYHVISVTTMPPVLMGSAAIAGRMRCRHTRVVYHCMDLYPEAALAMGLISSPLLARCALWLDNRTIKRATTVIVLSKDMVDTLDQRFSGRRDRPVRDIAISNNFIVEDIAAAVAVDDQLPETTKARFVFAGNLGRFQGIETLTEAIGLLHQICDDFEVVFLGDGALKEHLENQVSDGAPIILLPFRPLNEAMTIIDSCDVAIVSLSAGVIRAAYPSKVLTYLEMGKPLLAVVEADSSLASLVHDRAVGVVARPGESEDVANQMRAAIEHAARWNTEEIRSVGHQHFDRSTVLQDWARLYGLRNTI